MRRADVSGGERGFEQDRRIPGFALRLPIFCGKPERAGGILFEMQPEAGFLLEVELFAAQSGLGKPVVQRLDVFCSCREPERVFREGTLLREWPRGTISYLQPGIRLYRIAPDNGVEPSALHPPY